jgi:cbb3-type cytochrome oxidase subunit 3
MYQAFYSTSAHLLYPLVALFVFLVAFAAQLVYVYWPRARPAFQEVARLPLESEEHHGRE